jgi:hypothetical protein
MKSSSKIWDRKKERVERGEEEKRGRREEEERRRKNGTEEGDYVMGLNERREKEMELTG